MKPLCRLKFEGARIDFPDPIYRPIPWAGVGQPEDHGVDRPPVMVTLSMQQMFRFLFRASAVLVTAQFESSGPGFNWSGSGSFVATRRVFSYQSDGYDAVGSFVLGDSTPLTNIRQVLARGGGLEGVGGLIDSVYNTLDEGGGFVSQEILTAQVLLGGFDSQGGGWGDYGEIFTTPKSPARALFMDTDRRYSVPRLYANVANIVSGISGSFLGRAFQTAGNPTDQNLSTIASARIDVAFSGPDLPF